MHTINLYSQMKFVFPYRFYKLWTTSKKERDKRGPLDTGIVLNAIYLDFSPEVHLLIAATFKLPSGMQTRVTMMLKI